MNDARFNNAYGRCPLGNNPAPGNSVIDADSSTKIDDGEEQPLFWSEYYQMHVCKIHLDKVADIFVDQVKQENDIEEEAFRSQVGFRKTID